MLAHQPLQTIVDELPDSRGLVAIQLSGDALIQ
jgi:hypothetical protein